MITKINIRDLFKDFANKHLQIADFGYGVNQLWEVDKDLDTDGVYMYVKSATSPLGLRATKLSYEVILMDVPNDKEDNSAEIESDTHSIALDLLSYLEFNGQEVGKMFSLDKQNGSIEPFPQEFDSRYVGNILRISITAPFNYNTCQIPFND